MILKTKRLDLPRSVKIPRKRFFWGPSVSPGKYPTESSVSLLTVLRDYLHLGDKEREITRILTKGLVKVDGRVVKERRFSIGFMDVISIAPIGENYRVLYSKGGFLAIARENESNASIKLLKVKNKHTIKGGRTQISFHDGTNIIYGGQENIKTGDVVKFDLTRRGILSVYPMKVGSKVYLTGGSHVGQIATIKDITVKSSSKANMISFDEGFSTLSDYVFTIGYGEDYYSIPEVLWP